MEEETFTLFIHRVLVIGDGRRWWQVKDFQVSKENSQNSNEKERSFNFLPCPECLELGSCTI